MPIRREELESHYRACERPLYNFALRWTWNPASAQELVQEAFVAVWKRRDEIEGATLRSLLFTVVANLAKNGRRRARLAESIPLLDWVIGGATTAPDKDFLEREGQGIFREAIEALPAELRETLLLSQFSGLSQEEVGAALGISSGTVASRRSRALALLRDRLGTERIEL